MKHRPSAVRRHPVSLGKAIPFFTGILALPLATTLGQTPYTVNNPNAGWNVRSFAIGNGNGQTDNNLEDGNEIPAIYAALGAPGTIGAISANGRIYDITQNVSGTSTVINFPGDAGNFGGNVAYNTLPGYGTFNGGDQYSTRASAFLAIPVGTWSIAIASDDGRRMQLAPSAGATIPSFVFSQTGDQVNYTAPGAVGFNSGTGHEQSVGVFTINASDAQPGTNLALLNFDGFMFEGGGGDSFEIFIKSGADNSVEQGNGSDPATFNDGWRLLTSTPANSLGWYVGRTAISITTVTATGSLTWDGTTGNWNETDATAWNTGTPPASGTDSFALPTGTTDAYVPSGIVNVTDARTSLNLDIAATLGAGPSGGRVQVAGGGTLTVVNGLAIGATGALAIDGTGAVNAFTVASTGSVTLSNGGTLTATAGGTLGNLTLVNTGTLSAGAPLSAATTTLNNATLNIINNSQVTLNTVGEVPGTGNLTLTGNGTLILPTANTYTGVTTISGGTIRLGNGFGLGVAGTAASGTVINGGTLDLAGFRAGSNTAGTAGNEFIQVQGTGVGGLGAIINTGGQVTEAFRQVTLTGNATFRTDSRWDIRNSGGAATFDMGGFTLTKVGAQELALVNVAILNPGSVNVNQQIFRIEGSTDFDGTGTINVGGGNTLDFWSNAQTHNVNVTLQNNANLTTSNANGPTIAGTLTLAGQGNINTAVPLTLSGQVTGAGGMVKAGTGRLLLSNAANNQSGPTTINAGVVEASKAGALGTSSHVVASGAALELTGAVASDFAANVTAPIVLNGTGVGGTGALRSTTLSKTVAAPVTLATSATITNATAATTLTLAGPVNLSAASTLTLDGAGNTVISTAFGNGSAPALLNGIQETFYDRQNPAPATGNNAQNDIESHRAATLIASDGRGVLTGQLSYPDDNAVNARALALGAVGFNADNSPTNGDNWSATWVTTFKPDVSGIWNFRNNGTIDDNSSYWLDTNANGIFEIGERFYNTGFTTAAAVRPTPTLTAGTSYLLGFIAQDTGGGGAFTDLEFQRPGGAFTDVNPGANFGLFSTLQTPSNAMVKSGTGTATLTASNTYNGGTTINGGALLANGAGTAASSSTGTGNVVVNSGGFLGGNGTVGIASTVTTLNSGATLSAGGNAALPLFGVGTLSFQGGLNLASGSTAAFQLNSTTLGVASAAALAALTDPGNGLGVYDQVLVNGPLAFASGSTVTLDLTGYTPKYGDVFDLFDFTGASLGALPNFVLQNSTLGGLSLDTSRFLSLGVVAIVPEPSRALLLLAGVCALTARRRRRAKA